MTKKEIAKTIGITEQTLHNWKKSKPVLYKIILEYFEDNENNFNGLTKEEVELIKAYRQLDNEEKELYSYEIKARALRKKLK